MIAPDEKYRRLCHELQWPPYHEFLQLEAIGVGENTISFKVKYRPEFRNSPVGDHYHGGVLAALVDIAAHAAVATETGRTAPTIDLRIDYLRPAPGMDLIVNAKLIRLGRTIARADVEIGGKGTSPFVVGRGTFSVHDGGSAHAVE